MAFGLRLAVPLGVMALFCASAAFAQDGGAAASYAGSVSGGASVFTLPGYDTGVFGHVAGGTSTAITLGGTFGAQVGVIGDWGVLVGISTVGAMGASTTATWSDKFTKADSAVVIRGLSTPAAPASIDLNRGVGTANSTVTGPGGAVAFTTAAGGTNNVAGVTPDGTGFVMSSSVTGATSAAAYGGIGSSSGGIFIASGDIDGLVVNTTAQRNFVYWGADLTIGLQGQVGGNLGLQVYAGPSFRQLSQNFTTTIDIDIPELQPSVLTHPNFRITIADTLAASYLGGVVGANLSIPLAEQGIIFTLGAEGGAYAVTAQWTGRDTYSTCCGAVGTPLATPSPSISVNGPLMTANLGTTTGFAARGSASVTWLLDASKSVTLGGNAEYLSAVPTLSHAGLTQTGAAEDWTAPGTGGSTTLGWGSMINYGVSLTFSARF